MTDISEILSENFYWKLDANGNKIVHLNQKEAKSKIQELITKHTSTKAIEELEILQILDFEPDEPEIEAKYPTQTLDEYLEERIKALSQEGK